MISFDQDLSNSCLVLTSDPEFWRTVLRPATSIPSVRDGRSLRPERITIRPEPGSMENIHSAQVRELIYLGDHMRTRVTLLGHDDFVIKVANSAGHQHLKVGETVMVGWHAEDCRALDRL